MVTQSTPISPRGNRASVKATHSAKSPVPQVFAVASSQSTGHHQSSSPQIMEKQIKNGALMMLNGRITGIIGLWIIIIYKNKKGMIFNGSITGILVAIISILQKKNSAEESGFPWCSSTLSMSSYPASRIPRGSTSSPCHSCTSKGLKYDISERMDRNETVVL